MIDVAEFVDFIEFHCERRSRRCKRHQCGDGCNSSQTIVHGTISSCTCRHPTHERRLRQEGSVWLRKKWQCIHPAFRSMNKLKASNAEQFIPTDLSETPPMRVHLFSMICNGFGV